MSSNLENNDKILKVFNTVRCLNRDQLPRYLDGRLTDVEKHLVEQHLVDCDLCFDALQNLQQAKYREQYQPLAVNIQNYIRNSIRKVSTTQKVERYQRLEKKKESFLIYFWVVAGLFACAGVVYLVQQQNRLKALAPAAPIAEVEKIVQPAVVAGPTQTLQETGSQPVADTQVAAPVVAAVPAPVVTEVKPVVKRDTVKAAPPAPKPQPAKDSSKKVTEEKEEKEKEKPAPVVEKKEEKPAPAPAPAPKKEKDDDEKKADAPTSNGTDEFLYKAAMVYHQQGDLNEAISRYKHLTGSDSKYGELSRYQLAVCYRSKGQTGKARRMFKEVVRMNGSMKEKAQAALDSL